MRGALNKSCGDRLKHIICSEILKDNIKFIFVSLLLLVFCFVILIPYLFTPGHVVTDNINEYESRPLLILFTSFTKPPNSKEIRDGYEQVLRNWASFPLDVQPVLFIDAETEQYLAQTAVMLNWKILPYVKRDEHGHLILKEMYRVVYRKFNSVLYGYAREDSLFDESLVSTLQGIFYSLHRLGDVLVFVKL